MPLGLECVSALLDRLGQHGQKAVGPAGNKKAEMASGASWPIAALVLGKPRFLAANSIFSRVFWRTFPRPFSTRSTVETDTPAARAMSFIPVLIKAGLLSVYSNNEVLFVIKQDHIDIFNLTRVRHSIKKMANEPSC